MMENNLKKKISCALDCAYELEGLLHLALERNDIQEKLLRLIYAKGRELCGKVNFTGSEESAENNTGYEETDSLDTIEVTDGYELEEESEKPVKVITEKSGPVFSLNDTFLFTRELFGGDNALFKDTVNRAATMENIEEVEMYLYDELSMDSENDEVKRFVSLIEDYLESR